MATLLDGRSTDGPIANLRSTLEGCRIEVDTARHDAAFGDDGRVAGVPSGLELRLNHLAGLLDRATRALDRIADSGPATALVPGDADVLAREADHRVKNSLQTLIGLLQRQEAQAEAEAVRGALRVASARIAAIAEVHAAIHANPKQYGITPELDLGAYLNGLCATLRRALGVDGSHRVLRVEVEALTISPATARSLGLIVTELVTNALKHAFQPTKSGTVWVTGRYLGDEWYQLRVKDDGTGLPRGFDPRLRPTGLGLRLVNLLADQERARLTVDGRAGARFTLALPISKRGHPPDKSPYFRRLSEGTAIGPKY